MSHISKINKRDLVLFTSCFSLSSLSFTALAGDVGFNAKVNSVAHIYETKRGEEEFIDNQALVITPSLLSTYTSKGFIASALAEHIIVEQGSDIEGADKSYTELQYNGTLTLIPNSMYIGFTGSRNYRVVNQLESDFGDKVLSPGDLTQYRSNGTNFSFSIPNPKYIGFSLQTSYNQSNSEESIDEGLGIDTQGTSSSVYIYQGRKARGYKFNLSAQNTSSKRSQFSDFKSTNINGSFGISLVGNTDFVLVGSIDEYETDITDGASTGRRNDLDSNSYGAGFEWNPREGRQLKLSYNQIEEVSGNTRYIGLNTDWSFSSRTKLSLDISKKFYGDAYRFSLSQNLKNFRVAINYDENVTSYANLGITSTPQLFVCSLGATELADCYQPDSTDYVLKAGEEFLNLNRLEANITEEVFLQKSGSINIGYDKRKIKASLNASYAKTEYLESDRESANRGVNFSFSYKLGKKTTADLGASLTRRTNVGSEKADLTKSFETSFNRNLNPNTSLNLSAKIVDRDSENLIRDLTDKRITLGIEYIFF
ncbi:hypothetical protein [Paraglaciecola sp. L3A3]|uniref:hypothetical protein n=1 Tax=Paraglaciecola sp. L3A3 TaxID=2686358 RepID=UPI00131DC619|nr:hypothetical protein [Paraglaciecola sp. L3A3]